MRRFAPLALLVLMSLPASAAELVVGPFVREAGPDRAVIAFETDVAPGAAAVEFGETDAYGTSVVSTSTGTWHEVTLTGLPPKTLRHYRVVLDGAPAGRAGTFITAPATPEPFTFLMYGDSRSDAEAHAMVVARMAEHPASFLINTGDLVSNGSHVDEWRQFFGITAELGGDMPFLAVPGNHDMDGDGPPDDYIRFFGPVGAREGPGTYRTQDWAGVRLIYLDRFYAGTIDVECYLRTQAFEFCFDKPQMDWLHAQLDAARTDAAVKHVLVVVHEGPYSSKPDRGGAAELRMLLNDFARSKVRAVLSGHDHYYEHGIAGNGMHYVISGGGGAPLYETVAKAGEFVPPHEVVMSVSTYNFQRVRVDGDSIEITTFQADGTEMESFEVLPGPPCAQADECPPPAQGWCAGEAECTGEHRCIWACDPPPECIDDATMCEMRTPVEDCPGAWACLESKCLWECDPVPDPGPGDTGPADSGPTDEGPAADAAPVPDPGPAVDTAPGADVPPVQDVALTNDNGPATPPDAAPPAKKSGGCSAPLAPGAAPALPPALLVLGALLRVLRRRRR